MTRVIIAELLIALAIILFTILISVVIQLVRDIFKDINNKYFLFMYNKKGPDLIYDTIGKEAMVKYINELNHSLKTELRLYIVIQASNSDTAYGLARNKLSGLHIEDCWFGDEFLIKSK